MFRNCLIDNVIMHATSKGCSLGVIQRYLSVYYHITASLDVLKKRKRNLWISGKFKFKLNKS